MKLKQLMTSEVRSCSPEDNLSEAARIMSEVNCGAVPVVEGQKVVGIITDRDIVLRAVAQGKDGQKTKIRECMTSSVIHCPPDTDAHRAASLMAERQIRRLPVVENDRLVGIVALGDLATQQIHVNEAGDALSSISEPAEPGAH